MATKRIISMQMTEHMIARVEGAAQNQGVARQAWINEACRLRLDGPLPKDPPIYDVPTLEVTGSPSLARFAANAMSRRT